MPTNKPSIARYRVTLALPIPGWRRRGWTPRRRHFVKHNGAKLCLTPPNLLSSPSFSSSASTTEAGRRTARLLPHFATRIGSSTDTYFSVVYPQDRKSKDRACRWCLSLNWQEATCRRDRQRRHCHADRDRRGGERVTRVTTRASGH